MLCESLQPCGWKGNAIIEAEDVRLMSICSAEDECIGFCRFSERESGLTVYERWSDIKFRCKGGGADTAGKNARKIAGYIQGRCFVRPADTRAAQPFTDGKQQNAPAGVLYAVNVAGSKKATPVV